MKKRVLQSVGLLFCLMLSLSLYAQDKKPDAAKFVGEWVVSIPDAPYGYQDATAVMELKEGKMVAEFTMNGAKMKVNNLKEAGEGYTCSVDVDGYPVYLTLFLKEGKLQGTAEADGSLLTMNFKKKEK